jgi:hypothetical protein
MLCRGHFLDLPATAGTGRLLTHSFSFLTLSDDEIYLPIGLLVLINEAQLTAYKGPQEQC